MNSGPVAQFIPNASGFACRSDAHMASTVWPASIVPIGSIVTEMMNGTSLPISFESLRTARMAALMFRVSWQVSTSSKSTPPSTRPFACA